MLTWPKLGWCNIIALQDYDCSKKDCKGNGYTQNDC